MAFGISASALFLGGAALTSGVVGAVASSSAAKTQANAATNAANTSAALQERMFNKQVELQEPWRQAGVNALTTMGKERTGMPAAFAFKSADMYQDPGYAFRLNEGLKALDRTAASRGGLISGAALKGATRYGQEMGSQEYQNAYNRALTEYNAKVNREATGYNRLASLAGIGQTATGQLSSAAGNLGSNLGNTLSAGITGAAGAQAAGTMGVANAISGGVGQGINYYQGQQMMNRLFPSSGMSGASTSSGALSNEYMTSPSYFGGSSYGE